MMSSGELSGAEVNRRGKPGAASLASSCIVAINNHSMPTDRRSINVEPDMSGSGQRFVVARL